MRLLVVEDDQDTSEGICEYFSEAGYEVTAAYNGEEALSRFSKNTYDLVLLDIMLPKLSGLSVLHEIRKSSDVPVIMLTAIGDEHMQIASFDGLADDYVTKPFSILLLEKRIKALLRRRRSADTPNTWHYRNITVNFAGYTAEDENGPIDVTPRELQLLKLLLENKGTVLTRERILDELWGVERPVFDRTVDSHIKNLRKKLNLDCIVTVTGVGYKLEDSL